MNKILSIIRKIEFVFLKFFLKIWKWLVSLFTRAKVKVGPNYKAYLKTGLYAVIILYVIGGVVFGVRLYKQKKFEKIDLTASYVYPFPVATAGRGVIFDYELQRWVSSSKFYYTKNNAEIPKDLYKQILDELVTYNLASQEADKLGIKLSQKKDIDETFRLSIEGIGNEEQAMDFVKQMYGVSLGQFKSMITPRILLEKIRNEKFVHLKARHILVKDENKAKDLVKKIREGAKFEDVAKDNSEDESSKEDGGLLAQGEFLFKEGLIKEIEDVLFTMKPGDVSDPVKSEYGFHILKVEEKAGTIELKMADWLESLKKEYPVRTWVK